MNTSAHAIVIAQTLYLIALFFLSTRVGIRLQRRGVRLSAPVMFLLTGAFVSSIAAYLVFFHDNSFGGMTALSVLAVSIGFLLESRSRTRTTTPAH